nr:hypothetical protein [Aquihabitans sp. G128]
MTGPITVSRFERVAHLEVRRHARELADQLVVDAALHDDPGGRGADLAGVEGPGAAHVRDDVLQVGVVEDDGRPLAAQLEQQALHLLAAHLGDAAADAGGAGEGDHVDVGRGGDGLGGLDRAGRDDVDHAGREPGLLEQLAHADHRERVLHRRLDHHGVAHGERRRDLAGHVGDREVVGGQRGDHADGSAVLDATDDAAGGQRRGRHDRRGQRHQVRLGLGVAAEAGGDLRDLHGLGHPHGGAGLGLHERDQLVAVGVPHVGEAAEQRAPLLHRGALPPVEGVLGGPAGVLGLLHGGVRRAPDDLLGRRVHDVVAGIGRHVLAADQQAVGAFVGHVGEL